MAVPKLLVSLHLLVPLQAGTIFHLALFTVYETHDI